MKFMFRTTVWLLSSHLLIEMEILILCNWERKRISKQLHLKLDHSFIFKRGELIAEEVKSIHYRVSLIIT